MDLLPQILTPLRLLILRPFQVLLLALLALRLTRRAAIMKTTATAYGIICHPVSGSELRVGGRSCRRSFSLLLFLASLLLSAALLPATAWAAHLPHARLLPETPNGAATSNATTQPDPEGAAAFFHPPANPAIETPDIMLAGADKLHLAADLAAFVRLGRVGKAVAQKFHLWAQKMGKRYDGVGPAEKVKRLLAFAANLAFIEAHNRQHRDQQLKLNVFSDMSFQEFKASHLGAKLNVSAVISAEGMVAVDAVTRVSNSTMRRLQQLPSSFDWTAKRVVTIPKNQKQCGEWIKHFPPGGTSS